MAAAEEFGTMVRSYLLITDWSPDLVDYKRYKLLTSRQNVKYEKLVFATEFIVCDGANSDGRCVRHLRSQLILTCHRRKSLSRTSPEVRMSRSGLGDLLLYKHALSSGSETSLSATERAETHLV